MDVGGVTVGGPAPVAVQSMTNTDTADVTSTVTQIELLADAGSELVRITVNNDDAARAVPEIVARIRDDGYRTPVVGDFHYNGHLLLTKYPDTAAALAKLRINPGNVGTKHRDDNFQQIVRVAIEHGKPVRIGVNWGSLDQRLLTELMDANAKLDEPKDAGEVLRDALVESAMRSAALAEETGLGTRPHHPVDEGLHGARLDRRLPDARRALRPCAAPRTHRGGPRAPRGSSPPRRRSRPLLLEGIGDTIRVSLTPKPGGDRAEEVRVAQQILQSLDIRHFEPQVTSCPGCGRTTSTFFQEMAEDITSYIRDSMPEWRKAYPGVESMDVAVMGCVVNGPGESKHANIGI